MLDILTKVNSCSIESNGKIRSNPIDIGTLQTVAHLRTLRICWATSTHVTLTNLALQVMGRIHSLVLYTSNRVDACLERKVVLQLSNYLLASFYVLCNSTLGLMEVGAWHLNDISCQPYVSIFSP